MSINFHAELRDSDYAGHAVHCYGDHGTHEQFPTYDEAVEFYNRGLADGTVDQGCCGFEVLWGLDTGIEEFGSATACALLEYLGFVDADGAILECGTCDPQDFLGRVLLARAMAPDEGVPAFETIGTNGARLVDFGRPAGAINRGLDRLERVAEHCTTIGRDVFWG